MKIEINTVKGFQDFLPPESLKREAVKKVIEKYFKLYGFLPIETPIIEFDELMRSESLEGEDQAISDRFKLQDRAKRNLGLRYEFTFQLSRILKQNPNLKMPFKRYQIGPVFRDEPMGPERLRQFVQCDADILGSSEIDSDAECLALASDILKELKITSEIQVNNRKLLNSIIESVQIQKKDAVMRELDKLDKISEDDVKANLKKYADANQIITLFRLLGKDLKFFKENAFSGSEELEDLVESCKAYGIKIKFNPFMMRGLSYYTGNIFEIKEPGKSTLISGGRYNKTVGKYLDRQIPAVGISFGLLRLVSRATIETQGPKAILISLNQNPETLNLAKALRNSEISCITAFGQPGKQLEFANSYQIPYAVFIGPEEVDQKKFKLKTLETGEEKLLSEKQLLTKLKK